MKIGLYSFSQHGMCFVTSNNSLCLSLADSSFEAEFLQTHNAYRKQHGAPPLTINKNLCRSSQAWAEHLLSIKTLKHSNKDYGENLYYAWSSSTVNLTGQLSARETSQWTQILLRGKSRINAISHWIWSVISSKTALVKVVMSLEPEAIMQVSELFKWITRHYTGDIWSICVLFN